VFVPSAANGGLRNPRGMAFTPDGSRLLVASHGTNAVLAYDAQTGQSLGVFSQGTLNGKLNGPWGIRVGPDGNVYVSASGRGEAAPPPHQFHLTDPRVFMYDGRTGLLIRAFVQRPGSDLRFPRGLDFIPGDGYDCNRNGIPDWCDIASGFSRDRNGNGIPDECEDLCYADCDENGRLDVFDFLCFQNAFLAAEPYADCDENGVLDSFDFLCFQNEFLAGCP
jgi:glucose/arabinose dehydrogenase